MMGQLFEHGFPIISTNAKTIYPAIPTLTAITTENNSKKTVPVENVVRWHTKKRPSDARNSLLRAVFLFAVESIYWDTENLK